MKNQFSLGAKVATIVGQAGFRATEMRARHNGQRSQVTAASFRGGENFDRAWAPRMGWVRCWIRSVALLDRAATIATAVRDDAKLYVTLHITWHFIDFKFPPSHRDLHCTIHIANFFFSFGRTDSENLVNCVERNIQVAKQCHVNIILWILFFTRNFHN